MFFNETECILHSFPIKYFGKSFSVEEYKNSSICESRICMRDSKRIIASVSYKDTADPCVNFKEFACGHFYEFKATNDRHSIIGFGNEHLRQHQHRLKRILKLKIHKDDPKIFRIIKSYFHKCVNSGKIQLDLSPYITYF